ncbi:MAG: hypothetical protein IPN71_10100 [Fibrobacteres bacterium]|nr:hypothetical protein [Fibrobacterota bacterium]
MIRFNLLRNRFQSSSLAAEPETIGSLSTLSMRTMGGPSMGKKLAIAAGVVLFLGAVGGGTWWFLNQNPQTEIAPPTQTAKPVTPPAQPAQPAQPPQPQTDTVKKDPVDAAKFAKDSARKADSLKVAEAAVRKADSIKVAKEAARKADSVKLAAAKPEPKKPEPKTPEPKVVETLPPPPPPSVTPRVVAPALAGGVVAQVIAESQSKGGAAPAPTRFEDLSPLARLSYQRFAFERILAVIRQVAPAGVKFTRIRLYSPGLVVIHGTSAEAEGVNTLIRGLLAQSLVDTALKTGTGGQFAIAARLPFSSSSVTNGKSGKDFASTLTQARDLAQTGGLTLSAPKAPSVQTYGSLKRASWKLSGSGPWESIGKWFAALQSMELPVGFTSASLSAGVDGSLKLEAEAISYAP